MNEGYDAYHAPRYAFLLGLLSEAGFRKGRRILDIGPSRLTSLIREKFDSAVDTLGFKSDRTSGDGRHFEIDLNTAGAAEPDLPPYDFVVMAEVIEHLHTAPEMVMTFVRRLMAANSILILQTPNAASLPKRIKLLFGRNPYERIRLDASDPGHFREYTVSELRSIMSGAGFVIQRVMINFYFDARFAHHEVDAAVRKQPVAGALKNMIYPLLPASLREGITIIATPDKEQR